VGLFEKTMNNKNNSISVIIPCYNEYNRIVPIINQIKKVKTINEIIVVDDGSNISTKKILKNISGIKLITHPQNKGKTAALKTGVSNTDSNIIAFVDSDLTNFKSHHLESLLNPVLIGDYELILSEKENESLHSKMSGFSIAFTGERVLKKELLDKHPEIFKNKGYLVEASINKIFFEKHKVGKVFLKGVGQYPKIKKNGIKGLYGDIKMLTTIVKFLKIKNFINQLKFAQNLPNC